ncbi:unnamed protein product [Rhizophagus irregularis]|nr:unnamed protein product [Rhizophagus irregularis]
MLLSKRNSINNHSYNNDDKIKKIEGIFKSSDYDLDKDERKLKYKDYNIILCEKCNEKFNRDWHCRKCYINETEEGKHRMLYGICKECSQAMKIPSKGGFAEVYSATWTNGRIEKWDHGSNIWKRSGPFKIALKILNNSKDLSEEFLNELKFLRKFPNYCYKYIIKCFGITQEPNTLNYAKYTKQYEENKNSSYDLVNELNESTIIISPSESQEKNQNKSAKVNRTSSIIVIGTTKSVNISGCDECFDCAIENYLSVNSYKKSLYKD